MHRPGAPSQHRRTHEREGALSAGRVVIAQATGMVVAQRDTDVIDAGRCLRSLARRTGRTLLSVAEDVVARRLRLD